LTTNEAAGKHTGRCPVSGKRTYLDRREARLAARRAHPGLRMVAYRCPHCGMWHYANPLHRRGRRR
jgi:hypothetical protein